MVRIDRHSTKLGNLLAFFSSFTFRLEFMVTQIFVSVDSCCYSFGSHPLLLCLYLWIVITLIWIQCLHFFIISDREPPRGWECTQETEVRHWIWQGDILWLWQQDIVKLHTSQHTGHIMQAISEPLLRWWSRWVLQFGFCQSEVFKYVNIEWSVLFLTLDQLTCESVTIVVDISQ